jgi:hypothetical protein
MAKALPWKGSFNGGELSPRMAARTDQGKYAAGCQTLQNFIPTVQGPLIRRGGTMYVNEVNASANRTWLVPFTYQVTQSFQLEFGDRYIRFFTNRGIVTEAAINITGATQANPVVLTVANSFTAGQEFYVAGVVGMTQLNNRFFRVASATGTTITLEDTDGNPINGTAFSAYVSGGTVARIFQITSPYAVADLTDAQGNFRLRFQQSEDVMYMVHPSYPDQQISYTPANGTTGWAIAKAARVNGPFQDNNNDQTKTVTVTPTTTTVSGAVNNGSGLIRLTVASTTGITTGNQVNIVGVGGTSEANGAWAVTVIDVTHIDLIGSVFTNAFSSNGTLYGRDGTAITITANSPLFTSTTIGADGMFYLENPLKITGSNSGLQQWYPGKAVSLGDRWVAGQNGYIAMTGGTSGNNTPVHTSGSLVDGPGGVVWLYEDTGYGSIQITSITDSMHAVGTVMVTPPYLTWTAGANLATFIWAYGLFDSVNGYPEDVTIFRDRVCYYKGIQLAGSVTSDYLNFSPTVNGVQTADSGFVITLPTSDAIRWMSSQNDLLVGTAAEEILVSEIDPTQAFGPGNIKTRRQTPHGSRFVEAIPIEFVTMFVTRSGQQLRQMIYSVYINGYAAEDLTTLSEHIPKGPDGKQGILQMAWQQEPDLILWCATTDGRLVGFTYNRDQQVLCWHNHPLGGSCATSPLAAKGFTNAVVECVSSIPSPDGTQDDLWLIVRRTINGVTRRYVEYLVPYFTDIDANLPNAFYVDAGLTYSGASSSYLTGARHLVGQTVDVLAGGGSHPQVVVDATGGVQLQFPVTIAQIGLPCPALVVPMRLDAGSQLGSAQGSIKRIVKLVMRLLRTVGGKFGDPNNGSSTYEELDARSVQNQMDTPVPTFTGDVEKKFPSGFNSDGYSAMLFDKPFPATLVGLRHEVTLNENTD